MTTSEQFEWRFGGVLQGMPASWAWGILLAALLCGLLLIAFSYRRTLRALPPRLRLSLTALRAAVLLALLLLLADPSRVQTQSQGKGPSRRLAVLVDRSASMITPDSRNQARISGALRIWRGQTDGAARAFDHVDYFRFGSDLEKADGLASAVKGGAPAPDTRLWSAIEQTLATSPSAIVCITDGLDTSGTSNATVLGEAQRKGIPLYFLPATNHSRAANLLAIRDLKMPSRVLRNTKFAASAVMEISTPVPCDVPVEVWSGQTMLASATLTARPGWNMLPWSAEIVAGEAGPMPLEFRLGEGPTQEIASSTVSVVEKTHVDVLYYQGALQWGFRFLRASLESTPSFHLTGILNPALGVRLNVAQSAQETLPDLPDNASDLKRFQIVVLAHAFADMLTQRQQQALVEYARGGGGVLFITPDTDASRFFANTPLEEMLPVVFERQSPQGVGERDAQNFQEKMMELGTASSDENAVFGDGSERSQNLPVLTPFKAEPGAAAAKIFPHGGAMPMFSTFARVHAVKSGAEVLAVNPDKLSSGDGKPCVLVARQRFGDGFTAVLNTDLLWRWKMSLPHESHAVEAFWQQLLLSLTGDSGEGLRIVTEEGRSAVNRPTRAVVIGAANGDIPVVNASSPSGKNLQLLLTASPKGWLVSFIPDCEGRWQVAATDSAGNQARVTQFADSEQRNAENSNAPADIDGMREAAEAAGGALIGPDFDFKSAIAASTTPGQLKSAQPLWDRSWIIGLLLGVYSVELITRRISKLL